MRSAYEKFLMEIGFTRIKAMDAVQALFEEGCDADDVVGSPGGIAGALANKSTSRALTAGTSMTT